ncbi:MAG: polyketide cyclase [Massilia sp.]|nr:polyketide cyclase [Massilia sp.]
MTQPDTAVAPSDVDFRITRTFNAPRALVFKTMTETQHLQHWWGPKGCRITVKSHDPRPGGMFHYCMHFPGGVDIWGRFVYREITPTERIVFINGFADAEGKAIANPMSPDWPFEMLNTTTLADQGGKTVLTLLSQPINATDLERANFLEGHASMQGGFGGMYDVYEQYLATIQQQKGG